MVPAEVGSRVRAWVRDTARFAVDEVVVAVHDRPRIVAAVGAGAAIAVVSIVWILVTVVRPDPIDAADQITYDRLVSVAERLSDDLNAGIVTVDDDMVRRFETHTDAGLVGTIAQRSSTGQCLGFEVTVPDQWLVDGTGTISVGVVGAAPDLWCEPAR